MRRHIHRVSLGLGILGLAAAGAAAAFLAFASGSNAASSKSCTQQSSTQANCVVVSVVPGVLSSNQTGLIVAKFKNTFATATATHTVIGVTLPKIDAKDQPTSPALATATSVSSSAQPNGCPGPLTQKVSCSFGSVPGGAT